MADPMVDKTVDAQAGTGLTADNSRRWSVEIEKTGGDR